MEEHSQEQNRRRAMSESFDIVAPRIFFALERFSEGERGRVKDIFEGKEVVIEHDIRYGKVVCRFIPTLADDIIKKDLQRQRSGELPVVIFQCGAATRALLEEEAIGKIKAGASADELLDHFIKTEQVGEVTFYEPIADITKPYYFSQYLIKVLPEFINYLVEKLDIKDVCIQLDEYQTLDFIPEDQAHFASKTKKILVDEFVGKHSNEKDIKDALRMKWGGARKRKGFVWKKNEKAAFYQAVISLPKKDNESCWTYALKVLIEHEFDPETIAWLISRPVLKDVPKQLFSEAVKIWRKYLELENWDKMKQQEKPRAFEYQHALYLLNYPDEYTYKTLDTHFYAGKKVSDFQK
jgi:hypothetical protein